MACVAALAVITAVDYLHSAQISPVSSAVPAFIFQLILLADKRVRDNNNGAGILRLLIRKLTGNNQ